MLDSKWIVMVVSLCAVAGSAGAEVYSYYGQNIDVEYWAGTGENEAICVIDFAASSTPGGSYAFGYRWDGSATSEDMLIALDGDGVGGTVDVSYYNDPTYGFGLTGLSYNGYSIVSDGWTTTFPGFWWDGYDGYTDFGGNPVAGESPDGTFAESQLGAATRSLASGYLDGWSQEYVDNGYSPINTPVVPVPEPASLGLLSIGALAMLRRRRK